MRAGQGWLRSAASELVVGIVAVGVAAVVFSGPAFAGGFVNPGEASPAGDMKVSRGATGELVASFTPGCNVTSHAAYWGIGPITGAPSWQGVVCDLPATGVASFDPGAPPAGSVLYFVMVGQNSSKEGSYGRSSAGVERPQANGLGACDQPQVLLASCMSVDFARPKPGVKSQSGFLDSILGPAPGDDKITPVQPAQWRRRNFADYDRVTGAGARFQVILSDMWGYPNPTYGWPYQNYTRWENFVRSTARIYAGRPALWDVWNEPDDSYYWPGTQAQFFETYRRAYVIIRQELGEGVLIGGPSYKTFDENHLAQFLDFCRNNACGVSYLSWHEVGTTITGIAGRLRDARQMWVDNPAFASLGLKEIQVNKIVGSGQMLAPGAILGFFYYLEAGGSDGACKACWMESDNIFNCRDTLDGLLTQNTYEPRAAWWLYKSYVDGVSSRVDCATNDPGLVALAAADVGSTPAAQVIVGYFDSGGAPAATPATVTLNHVDRLPFVAADGQVRLRIERVPNSGEAPQPAPILIGEDVRTLVNGALLVTFDGIALNNAYLLTLSAP